MELIYLNDEPFYGSSIRLGNERLLVIRGANGALGCGYLNIATAEKFGYPMAIVCGVKNFQEMCEAEVREVSSPAAALGVRPGMTGREALLLMK